MNISQAEMDAIESKVNGNAAIQAAYSILGTSRMKLRAKRWDNVPVLSRKLVMRSANMSVTKADAELQELTPQERIRINHEAVRLIRDLEEIIRATQGGFSIAASPANAPHIIDGIAALSIPVVC